MLLVVEATLAKQRQQNFKELLDLQPKPHNVYTYRYRLLLSNLCISALVYCVSWKYL